ncbi:MAG: hypothetical protein ACMXX5_00550 [Candidatus Woesearchaeota archaeon]
MIKSTKSQAAMEFLMTYGWALLVVLIAIAALAFFGLLNPSRFLPERADLGPGLVVQDSYVDEYKVVLLVHNGLGQTLQNFDITVDDCLCAPRTSNSITFTAGSTEIFEIYCTVNSAANSRFRSNLRASYTTRTAGHELQQSRRGEINWNVQRSVDYSSFSSVVVDADNCLVWQAGDSGDTLPWQTNENVYDFDSYNASDIIEMGRDLSEYPAIEYCYNLALCNNGSFDHTGNCAGDFDGVLFDDWRLPSYVEHSGEDYDIYEDDFNSYFKSSSFTDQTEYDFYWTGTSFSDDHAYSVSLSDNGIDSGPKGIHGDRRARCVRDQ